MTIDRIAVFGAGTMGHGIAQVAAQAGCKVALFDIRQELVDKGLASIKANLDKGVEKGKVTPQQREAALANLSGCTVVAQAAKGAQLVIEAVPEKLELKQSLFRELDGLCDDATIFASNTSSLSIAAIAGATRRPDRVLGMHFFNPVHIMKLLEVVLTARTSRETAQAALEFGRVLGKDCITVKDFPGFATSRLGVCLGLEAIRMVEQGVASPADIDKALELGYAHPMGPLRLTDLVGLDVRLNIAEYLHEELKSDVFKPPQLMRDMVKAGKLGKKSGEGFYKY
jgi:3-hydroxybutyryl-CoA dehydrogenase